MNDARGKRLRCLVWISLRRCSPVGARMEKTDARWGYGLFVGVWPSHQVIVVDCETTDVKYVRTVRKVLLEQRRSAFNLEWVRVAPPNRSEEEDADGDVPEFDVKQGPEGRLDEASIPETPNIEHRAKQVVETLGILIGVQGVRRSSVAFVFSRMQDTT